jgi:hypothetical protein
VKTLFLHPEDSLRRGPWTAVRWDLVIDLGKSSSSIADAWQTEFGSPVVRLDSFRRPIEDPRHAGQVLRKAWGRLLDREGIDWWELTSLLIHSELETVLAIQRLLPTLPSSTEIFATRGGWPIACLEFLLDRKATMFQAGHRTTLSNKCRHYQSLVRKFSMAQLLQIYFDKHDADLRLRARWSTGRPRTTDRVVLIPSAYTNVSRMAAAYAGILPELRFLLVYTRASGRQVALPANVALASLASYARASRIPVERAELQQQWLLLKQDLEQVPEIALLSRLGILDQFSKWFSDGQAVRNAWIGVFERENVQSVLCGDDSNWYTRLPVVLANKRGLPTADFHHGALDGRFLLKRVPSDIYFAKSEMELDYLTRVCAVPKGKVVIAGPPTQERADELNNDRRRGHSIVFFSEPYETAGARPEEIYRELLPVLAKMAVNSRCNMVLKLHPFESVPERSALVRQVLPASSQRVVQVQSGPLEETLLEQIWFGVTVESTTVIECSQRGITCFIAAWLATSLYEYTQQYSRFGLGETLSSVEELAEIPERLKTRDANSRPRGGLWQLADPGRLHSFLAGTDRTPLHAGEIEP